MIFRFGSKFEGEMLSQVSQSFPLYLSLSLTFTQTHTHAHSPGSVKPMYTDLTEQINAVHSFIMKSRKMGKEEEVENGKEREKLFFQKFDDRGKK